MNTEEIKKWMKEKGFDDRALAIDSEHRVSLYLKDVLEDFSNSFLKDNSAKKYYFINYRIDLKDSMPYYDRELIDETPFEWVIRHEKAGGKYSKRMILYAKEITEKQYKDNVIRINTEYHPFD